MKLAMLMIVAPDLARAEEFYGRALGFVLKNREPAHLVFTQEGADLVIFQGTANAVPAPHGEAASTTFVFAVPSLDAAMTALKAKGVAFLHAVPATGAFGRYAAFHDPFGNVLELLERAG
jgi:catechol 2,3-dioxygenase-like lactoylglutathione lyase family enzyme